MIYQPLVSVVIPSYNYAHLITRAVESVITQKYQHWELVICDDQSQDNSLELLDRYRADPRIQIYINEANLGLYGNVVRCISYTKGELIKILMADDWLHADYLQETISMFERYPTIGFSSVRTELIDSENRTIRVYAEPVADKSYYTRNEMMIQTMYHINPIGNPSRVIFRRKAYEEVKGFDLSIEYCTEYEMWLRMLENWDCAVVPKVLSYEWQHQHNATKLYVSDARHIFTAEQMFTKLFAQHSFFKDKTFRQQRVWLFGLYDYWNAALRHSLSGSQTEIKALIEVLNRNSFKLLWVVVLVWRLSKIIFQKTYSRLSKVATIR